MINLLVIDFLFKQRLEVIENQVGRDEGKAIIVESLKKRAKSRGAMSREECKEGTLILRYLFR